MPCRLLAFTLLLGTLSLAAGVVDPIDPFAPGHLFVVSRLEPTVFEFDEACQPVPTPLTALVGVTALTGLSSPRGLAFGPEGALYLTDFGLDRVFVYDGTSNEALAELGGGSILDRPTDLVFDRSGGLLVASSANDVVLRFDRFGAFDEVIGQGSGLDDPRGLALGPDGRLYVSSFGTDEVLVFDRSGLVTSIGAGSDLSEPHGLAFGPRGRLLVASHGNDRVLVFDRDGTLLETLGEGLPGFAAPTSLAFGPDGHLYVACETANAVCVLDKLGALVKTVTDPNLQRPTDLAFSPYVMGAVVRGQLEVPGVGKAKVRSLGRISYAPGSARMTLLLVHPEDPLAGTFGTDVLVFTGFEARPDPDRKQVNFVGGRLAGFGPGSDTAALGVTLRGRFDESGHFAPRRFKGFLHEATPDGALDARVRRRKQLP